MAPATAKVAPRIAKVPCCFLFNDRKAWRNNFSGFGSALERRSVNRVKLKAAPNNFVTQDLSLLDAGGVEQNVGLPHKNTRCIPIGFTMTDKIKFHKITSPSELSPIARKRLSQGLIGEPLRLQE